MPQAETFALAVKRLAKADAVLGGIIRQVGQLEVPDEREPFPALVRAICYQQLAGSAASAIMGRFVKLYAPRRFPSPKALLKTPDEALRSVGLSRQKSAYLKDLAAKFSDGTLNARLLRSRPDEEVAAALLAVKGIGQWTTDMFMIFTLQRLDVLPVGDLGIRKAVQMAYGLEELPKPQELWELGERWRPYRSIATLYLWRSVDDQAPLT